MADFDSMEITVENYMVNQIGNDLATLMKLANHEDDPDWDGGRYGSAVLHVYDTLRTLKIPVKVHYTEPEIYFGEPERDKKEQYTGVEICGVMFPVS